MYIYFGTSRFILTLLLLEVEKLFVLEEDEPVVAFEEEELEL